ncbi:hypothetical protein RB195_007512 [Necator americanus]|uniref:SCP domain-containing protein n=1 Tax=Necator americanus TaxID=51031 RepID=A0ABR1BXL5_NECAM
MFPILPVILALYNTVPLAIGGRIRECDESAIAGDEYRTLFLQAHNNYRLALANGSARGTNNRKLPGSKSLFKFNYNCQLELLASAVALDCQYKPSLKMNDIGYSQNFRRSEGVKRNVLDNVNNLENRFNKVVSKWWYTVEDETIRPMSPDVIYKDDAMEEFANIAYHKSISLGCFNALCPLAETHDLVTTCVYGAVPKKGAPLYPTAQTTRGCTDSSTCNVGVHNPECIRKYDEEDATLAGLCRTDSKEMPATATVPHASTTEEIKVPSPPPKTTDIDNTQNYQDIDNTQNYQDIDNTQNYQDIDYTQNYQDIDNTQNYHDIAYTQNYHDIDYTQNYHDIAYTQNYETNHCCNNKSS